MPPRDSGTNRNRSLDSCTCELLQRGFGNIAWSAPISHRWLIRSCIKPRSNLERTSSFSRVTLVHGHKPRLYFARPMLVTPSRWHLADFELRIPTGGAGFHVIATKTQTVLASRYWCEPVVTSTREQLTIDAGSNDSVRFVLSNCGSPNPVVSDFEV